MTTIAVVCMVLAAVFQLAGIGLLVQQARDARRFLREWVDANPQGHPEGSWDQISMVNRLATNLLADRGQPEAAIGLLVGGVLLGLAGGLLTV